MSQWMDEIAGLIDRGGVVMIPLLAISVVAMALVVERVWFWVSTNRAGRVRRLTRAVPLLARNDSRAKQALLRDDSIYGLVYRELANTEPAAQEATSIAAVEAVRPRMERFLTTLSTIITAAPLLGILGTVLGIIRSFNILSNEESLKDPSAVSAGIAEALLTTALGLVIALLTLFPYMIFRGQVDRTLGRLEGLVAASKAGAVREYETRGEDRPTKEVEAA